MNNIKWQFHFQIQVHQTSLHNALIYIYIYIINFFFNISNPSFEYRQINFQVSWLIYYWHLNCRGKQTLNIFAALEMQPISHSHICTHTLVGLKSPDSLMKWKENNFMKQHQHLFFKLKSVILNDFLLVINQHLNLFQIPVHWLGIKESVNKLPPLHQKCWITGRRGSLSLGKIGHSHSELHQDWMVDVQKSQHCPSVWTFYSTW